MGRLRTFLLFLISLLAAGLAHAQIQSAAFDPNCYQPQIGVDIDTIMGSYNGQMLGDGLINIGPSPDNPDGPGRLMIYGLPGTLRDSSAALLTVGPNFDPSRLNITRMLGFKPENPILGHFRSSKYEDMLVMSESSNPDFHLPRIFWQKEDGTYDSSFWTTLLPNKNLYAYVAPTLLEGLNPPYHACLTSDSAEDIVMMYVNENGITFPDSEMACFFRGGTNLFHPGDTILPDSQVFVDSLKNFTGLEAFFGNFRGTGRKDLVVSDNTGNLLFFANDRPFNLTRFVKSLHQDTLFSYWTSPWTFPSTFNAWWQGRVANVFGTNADDLVLLLDSTHTSGDDARYMQLRILKGHASFGSRITMDDAEFTLHAPAYFDDGNFRESGWGYIAECGNMAGTGDPVLGVAGNWGGDGSFFTFYVMGRSMDEKVDMFIAQYPYGGNIIDTATLDSDNLQDIAIGMPLYPDLITNGMQNNGSILFVHGTNKIPHKASLVTSPQPSDDPFSVSQSSDGNTMLIHARHGVFLHSTATLYDLLGRTVGSWEESSPEIDWRIAVPPHPAGAYVLAVTTDDKVFTYKLAMLK